MFFRTLFYLPILAYASRIGEIATDTPGFWQKTEEFLTGFICNYFFFGYWREGDVPSLFQDSMAANFYTNLKKSMGDDDFVVMSLGCGNAKMEEIWRREWPDTPIIATNYKSENNNNDTLNDDAHPMHTYLEGLTELGSCAPADRRRLMQSILWTMDATKKDEVAALTDLIVKVFGLSGRDRVVVFSAWPDEEISTSGIPKWFASAMNTMKNIGMSKIALVSFLYSNADISGPPYRHQLVEVRYGRSDLLPFFNFSGARVAPDEHGVPRIYGQTYASIFNAMQDQRFWKPFALDFVGVHTDGDLQMAQNSPEKIVSIIGNRKFQFGFNRERIACEYALIGNLQHLDLGESLAIENHENQAFIKYKNLFETHNAEMIEFDDFAYMDQTHVQNFIAFIESIREDELYNEMIMVFEQYRASLFDHTTLQLFKVYVQVNHSPDERPYSLYFMLCAARYWIHVNRFIRFLETQNIPLPDDVRWQEMDESSSNEDFEAAAMEQVAAMGSQDLEEFADELSHYHVGINPDVAPEVALDHPTVLALEQKIKEAMQQPLAQRFAQGIIQNIGKHAPAQGSPFEIRALGIGPISDDYRYGNTPLLQFAALLLVKQELSKYFDVSCYWSDPDMSSYDIAIGKVFGFQAVGMGVLDKRPSPMPVLYYAPGIAFDLWTETLVQQFTPQQDFSNKHFYLVGDTGFLCGSDATDPASRQGASEGFKESLRTLRKIAGFFKNCELPDSPGLTGNSILTFPVETFLQGQLQAACRDEMEAPTRNYSSSDE